MPEFAHPESLISTARLADLLADPTVRVLDGSFTMPGVTPNAGELFAERHIPGAQFFDIDAVSDSASPLPHMLPSPEAFEQVAGGLGIGGDTLVVAYDTPGLMSAGRVWWTFRVYGHHRVAVLDGGLKAWLAEGRRVESGPARTPAPASFHASFRPDLVRDRAAMLGNVGSQAEQVIDARAAPRFQGAVPEPRAGLRSGHIPGSLNLPSDQLTDPQTGRIKPAGELARLLAQAGVTAEAPVATTCGSGVTAAALAFGLHLIGRDDVAVYDGSWSEWGMPGDTPVETGAARSRP